MKNRKGELLSALAAVVLTLFLTTMWEGSQGKDFVRKEEFQAVCERLKGIETDLRDIRNFLMKDGKK